jgi:hypothetical protein
LGIAGPTRLDFHLTINPQKKLKATMTVSGQADIPDNDIAVRDLYMQHGLTLADKELRALKQSRPQGIQAINTMLGHVPGFADLTKHQRLNFAIKAADALLEKSLEAKLSREYPTALNEADETEQHLQMIFEHTPGSGVKKGPPPSLLQSCLWA